LNVSFKKVNFKYAPLIKSFSLIGLGSAWKCLDNRTFSCRGAQRPGFDAEGNWPGDCNFTCGAKQGTLSHPRRFYRDSWRLHADPSRGDDNYHLARIRSIQSSFRACSNVRKFLSVRRHHPPFLFSRDSDGVVRAQVL